MRERQTLREPSLLEATRGPSLLIEYCHWLVVGDEARVARPARPASFHKGARLGISRLALGVLWERNEQFRIDRNFRILCFELHVVQYHLT